MRVRTSSKKQQALNLNVYRNLHFRSLSAQKNKFYAVAKKLLQGMPTLGVITLHYEVFVKTKRRLDIMNVGSIVDKYFSDTLTSEGIIEDDDYTHIPEVSFAFGSIAKKEYVLVTITEIKPRKMPMRVLLDTADIQAALTTYVSTLNIPNASGVNITADSHGMITAEVMFLPEANSEIPSETVEEETKPKRRRGGRPAGSKNKPKEEPKEDENVGTPVQAGAADSSAGDTVSAEVEAQTLTASEDSPEAGEVSPATGTTKKGNLFGDKGTPSSEDDGQAEAAPESAPAEVPVKKGSIFDS